MARSFPSHHPGKTLALQPAPSSGTCSRGTGCVKPGGQSHRHRVLLIEDDPKDAEIFAYLLGKEDYDVEIAINGRDGLKLAEDGSFDVVLTDLNLGGAQWDEGRRVVKELRESRPDLPVILMTGLHTADIAIDVIQLGAFDYFSKPIDVDDPAFRLELSTMLEQAAASKRPAAPGETAG